MLISSNEIINIFIQIIEFETSPIFDAFLAVKKIISFFAFGNLLIWREKNLFSNGQILSFLCINQIFFLHKNIRHQKTLKSEHVTTTNQKLNWIFEKFSFTKLNFLIFNDWSSGWNTTLGPIIYFIEGRSPSRDKQVLHVAGTLMEYFLVLLRLWQVNSEEKICICYSSHLV